MQEMTDEVATAPEKSAEMDAQIKEAKQALGPTFRAAALGEMMSVFLQSPAHKAVTLGALSRLVLPAFLTKQYVLARAKSEQGNYPPTPVGIALWARVSDEVDGRLTAAAGEPIDLNPDEWRSGDNHWLIEVAAAPKVAQSIVRDLIKRLPDGQQLKAKVIGQDGKRRIKVFEVAESAVGR